MPRTLNQSCKRCDTPFVIELPPTAEDPLGIASRLMSYKIYCDPCCDLNEQDRQRAAQDERARDLRDQWETLCPPIYRDTDVAKLPRPKILADVMAWRYGPKGLVLHGATGLGKSRSAWLLLEREFQAGRRARVMNTTSALKYSAMFTHSCESALHWVEEMSACRLLFMDDIFKCRMTDSFEQALFAIIETRTSNGLPIIATTNDSGSSLVERMSQDRGGALIRRLREFCDAVSFQ
jgi:hypothetical protein